MVKKEIIWSNLAKLQLKAILEYYFERELKFKTQSFVNENEF